MDMWEDAMEEFYEPDDSLADELMREELEQEAREDATIAVDQAVEKAALELFDADGVFNDGEVDDWLEANNDV